MNKIITAQEKELLNQMKWNEKNKNKINNRFEMIKFLLIITAVFGMFSLVAEEEDPKTMYAACYFTRWECQTCGYIWLSAINSCPICGRPK